MGWVSCLRGFVDDDQGSGVRSLHECEEDAVQLGGSNAQRSINAETCQARRIPAAPARWRTVLKTYSWANGDSSVALRNSGRCLPTSSRSVDGQLPGAASYSHCRPLSVTRPTKPCACRRWGRRQSTIMRDVSRAITEFPACRTQRNPMNSRRDFIAILPFAGLYVLSACGEKATPTSAAPAPTPAPAPAVAPSNAPEPAAAPVAGATPAPPPAATAAGPMVDPAEAAAVALGYVSDAKATKDPKHAVGAACANCALFAGKPGEAAGPCPLYPGKQVAAAGWCTAYQKKA